MNNKMKSRRSKESIMEEIEKLRGYVAERVVKVDKLKEEIGKYNAKVKALENLYNSIYDLELQERLSNECFKGKKLTDEQILKFIEIGSQIVEKIDIIDADTIFDVVGKTNKKPMKTEPPPQIAESTEPAEPETEPEAETIIPQEDE